MDLIKEEENLRLVFAYFTTYHITMSDNLIDNTSIGFEKEVNLREDFEQKCWNKFNQIFPKSYLEEINNTRSGFGNKLISIVEKEISELKYKKRHKNSWLPLSAAIML